MITLTRLTGAPFALNPDLIERVDCTPDTVITLVDGTKYLVCESLGEVVDLALEFRARVVAGASSYEHQDSSSSRRTRLTAVPEVASLFEGDDRAERDDPSSQHRHGDPEGDLDDEDDVEQDIEEDIEDEDEGEDPDRTSAVWAGRPAASTRRDRSVISLEPRTL